MKTIKNKTYNNFIYIMNMIINKGYGKEEAEQITHRIFDSHNPAGLSIIETARRVMTKSEYETAYRG